jgi:hypothetical protein
MVLPQQCRHGVMKKYCSDCHPNLKQFYKKPIQKDVRGDIWDIIGECMSVITDAEKLLKIEEVLLDSEVLGKDETRYPKIKTFTIKDDPYNGR